MTKGLAEVILDCEKNDGMNKVFFSFLTFDLYKLDKELLCISLRLLG